MTLALVGLGFVVGRTMLERREVAHSGSHGLRANVSQRIREFRRVKVEDGRTAWELTAREAEYFEEQGQVLVDRPEVAFIGADGERVAVKGREGRVYLEGSGLEKIELGGGIEVRVGGYVLRTDNAVWVQAENVIVSPGRVEVQGEEMALEGEGMLVDLGRQRLQLLRGVRTTLHRKAESDPVGSQEAGTASTPAAALAALGEGSMGPHASAH